MAASYETIDADFVIVGAGSAGCVMAARLSEDPGTSVVLLEAGPPDNHFWIHVPLGYGKTITDKRVNWCYETEPDLNGRRFFWPRGKVLGGSSSINGLVYIRGQHEDFSLVVYQLRPESRGYLELKSANPADPPAMFPNYLATETDRRTIVDALKLGRRLLGTPDMQHFIASEYIPGDGVRTDDELLEYAMQFGGTVFHPTSTCKMGSDPMAVVDAELRLYRIGGLRVVDASIMPAVVSGNTNAATIMIAEKAADLVRASMRAGQRMAA